MPPNELALPSNAYEYSDGLPNTIWIPIFTNRPGYGAFKQWLIEQGEVENVASNLAHIVYISGIFLSNGQEIKGSYPVRTEMGGVPEAISIFIDNISGFSTSGLTLSNPKLLYGGPAATISPTEIAYLDGLTGNIQQQINYILSLINP